MSSSHSPGQAAVARQLADELDRYSAGQQQLLERPRDPALYRQLSDQFDRMQMQAQALPQLVRCWSDLLVSRVELTQASWESRLPGRSDSRVLALHAQHQQLVRQLHGICRGYLAD